MSNSLALKRQSKKASRWLKLLSHPVRLQILCMLANEEQHVSSLEEGLDISQSALSQHLAKMREMKLIKVKREGQRRIYKVADDKVLPLLASLQDIFC